MLVVTRRVGDVVMIGDQIAVKVVAVNGNQVRLGIEAPKTIAVYREEVFQRIQREKGTVS